MHLSLRSTFRLPSAARRRGRLAGWCLVCVGAAGCVRLSPGRQPMVPAEADVPGAAAVRFLGNVRVIGTGGRFVLVESSVAAAAAGLTDGQTLVCRAAGADTATLRVSRERRPPFIVADVASGEPHVGDEVFVEPKTNPAVNPAPLSPAVRPTPPDS